MPLQKTMTMSIKVTSGQLASVAEIPGVVTWTSHMTPVYYGRFAKQENG